VTGLARLSNFRYASSRPDQQPLNVQFVPQRPEKRTPARSGPDERLLHRRARDMRIPMEQLRPLQRLQSGLIERRVSRSADDCALDEASLAIDRKSQIRAAVSSPTDWSTVHRPESVRAAGLLEDAERVQFLPHRLHKRQLEPTARRWSAGLQLAIKSCAWDA